MDLNLGTAVAKQSSSEEFNYLAFIANIMKEQPDLGKVEGRKVFRKRLHADENYDEYSRNMEIQCWDNAYDAIVRDNERAKAREEARVAREEALKANPGMSAAAAKRKEDEKRRNAEALAISERIVEAKAMQFLKLVMPNDKTLGECTGNELGNFGERFKEIGKLAGKQLVRDVLSEEQLRKIFAKTRAKEA